MFSYKKLIDSIAFNQHCCTFQPFVKSITDYKWKV